MLFGAFRSNGSLAMNAPFTPEQPTLRMRVSPTGKVHLPTSLRRELGLEDGGILVAVREGKNIVITTLRKQMIDMREELAPYFKNDSVDQFLADRREEARREWEEH
jgi:bifunctional DNA-binding transcriptional regulator/antitoxin component of YhaV-PrlF toxin-antitoxin module